MEEDISKRTITILVMLTVIISVLGTLSVMSAVNDMKTQNVKGQETTQGKVSLTVTSDSAPTEKQASAATGKVALTITKNEPRILLLPPSNNKP